MQSGGAIGVRAAFLLFNQQSSFSIRKERYMVAFCINLRVGLCEVRRNLSFGADSHEKGLTYHGLNRKI